MIAKDARSYGWQANVKAVSKFREVHLQLEAWRAGAELVGSGLFVMDSKEDSPTARGQRMYLPPALLIGDHNHTHGSTPSRVRPIRRPHPHLTPHPHSTQEPHLLYSPPLCDNHR